jgi:hypothetical protein
MGTVIFVIATILITFIVAASDSFPYFIERKENVMDWRPPVACGILGIILGLSYALGIGFIVAPVVFLILLRAEQNS